MRADQRTSASEISFLGVPQRHALQIGRELNGVQVAAHCPLVYRDDKRITRLVLLAKGDHVSVGPRQLRSGGKGRTVRLSICHALEVQLYRL